MTWIFKDKDLALRLEATEGMSCVAYEKGNGVLHPDQGNKSANLAGATAIFSGIHSPISQAFGLGLHGELTTTDLDQVEEFFFGVGCDVNLEICPFADESLLDLLGRRGYRIIELSTVLVRDVKTTPLPERGANRTEVATDGSCESWARVIAEGWSTDVDDFGFMTDLARSMYVTDAYTKLTVFDGNTPAGAGCVFIREGVANLFAHTTLKTHRGRGVQSSLIAASLEIAANSGAEIAMAATAPGSGSQRNFERAGFEVAYSRFKVCLPFS